LSENRCVVRSVLTVQVMDREFGARKWFRVPAGARNTRLPGGENPDHMIIRSSHVLGVSKEFRCARPTVSPDREPAFPKYGEQLLLNRPASIVHPMVGSVNRRSREVFLRHIRTALVLTCGARFLRATSASTVCLFEWAPEWLNHRPSACRMTADRPWPGR